jgi:hypothetical protein
MAGLFTLLSAALCTGQEPASPTPVATTDLRFVWTLDHASGIYYPNEHATLSIVIENPSDSPQTLKGNFNFLRRSGPAAEQKKPVSTTPITPTVIGPGQRARIALAVTPPSAGNYEVTWDTLRMPTSGRGIECIYAPRGKESSPADSPWIAPLPEEAFGTPEFLADFIQRTAIHRFLWSCSWKPGQREILGPNGQALTQAQLDAILHALRTTGSQLVLRLHPQIDPDAASAATAEVNTYTAALIGKGNGLCKAVTVDVEPALCAAHPEIARDVYLAIYAAAKKQDHTIVMLGFSNARDTHGLLSGTVGGARLDDYVDALAVDGTPADAVPALDELATNKLPVWILPPVSADGVAVSPAVALAAGAKIIPLPAGDHGLTMHLFAGSVLYQTLHAGYPPYCAVFQANGFAVAAIAGMGSGTSFDRAWPGLLATMLVPAGDPAVAPGDDAPVMEVADPDTSLRVVDGAGEPINCRRGDLLRVPLNTRVCYLLESGSAEDLVAGLRTAELRNWPEVEVSVVRVMPADVDRVTPTLALRIRNATDHDVKAQVRLADKSSSIDVVSLSPGKYVEAELPVRSVPVGTVDLEVVVAHRPVRITVPMPK